MKTWLMELCPEIAEWQAEAIEEYHKSAVKLAREAVVQELVAGSGEPTVKAMTTFKDEEITFLTNMYMEEQLAGAVLRERERCAVLVADLSDMRVPASEYAAAIRGQA